MNDWVKQIELLRVENEGLKEGRKTRDELLVKYTSQVEALTARNRELREALEKMIYLAEMTRWNNEQEGWISTAKKALEVKE